MSSSSRRLALAALALPLAAVAVRSFAEDAEVVKNDKEGFSIERPSGFTTTELPPSPEAHFALKLERPGAAGEASLTIYVADAEGIHDASALRDYWASRWKLDSTRSKITTGVDKLTGDEAPFVKHELALGEASFEVAQHFLRHDGSYFVLVTVAPRGDDRLAALEKVRKSFAFVPVADPERREARKRVRKLAALCGTEVAWAKDWKEASARASSEKKLVLVAVERFRGVPGPLTLPSTVFMDRDVVALVRERFIALRWEGELEAPFRAPEVWGAGPFTFGQGVLVVSSEGKVLADSASTVPAAVDSILLKTLAAHPEASGAPVKDARDPAIRLERGELEIAAKLLDSPGTAKAWKLKAELHRRRREGEAALAALDKARELGEPVALEQGVVLLRLGKLVDAERVLAPWVSAHDDDAEARYWLAAARGMIRGLEPIRSDLEKLTASAPKSPWAWRAAALLSGLGLASGLDPCAWPDEPALAAVAPAVRAPLAASEAARAEREAIQFLVSTQRRDGSWASSFTLVYPGNPCDTAIASIAGLALLRHRDREPVAAALDRALAFVLAAQLTPYGATFDYTIWGQVFATRFLARCLEKKVGDEARLKASLAVLVAAIEKEQLASGGWAYFHVGSDPQSIGFVTAAALLALGDAKRAGVEVSAVKVQRASQCLASLRRPEGAFGYMTGPGEAKGDAEAAMRSPLCALALLRTGQGDKALVRASLDFYMKHHERCRLERGKVLCHTSPEGTASYYLLFGDCFAAEALGEIDAGARAPFRAAIVDDVLQARLDDASFVDDPALGRAYAAGMAAEALSLSKS